MPTLRPGVKEQYYHPKLLSDAVAILKAQCVPSDGRIGRTGDGDVQSVLPLGQELCIPAATARPVGE